MADWPVLTAMSIRDEQIIADATLAERERCAIIAERLNETVWELDNSAAWEIREHHGNEIAGAIRTETAQHEPNEAAPEVNKNGA